jgi:hypothetical protein
VLAPQRDSAVAGRPLVSLSFAINYAVGGLDVTGYHIGNIALHARARSSHAVSSGERSTARAYGVVTRHP